MDTLNTVFHISLVLAGILLLVSAVLFFRLRIVDVVLDLTGRARAAAIRKLDAQYAARSDRRPGPSHSSRSHRPGPSRCLLILILAAALLPPSVCAAGAAQTQDTDRAYQAKAVSGLQAQYEEVSEPETEPETERESEMETEPETEKESDSETETSASSDPGPAEETEDSSVPADTSFTLTIRGLSVTKHGKTAYPVIIQAGEEEIRVTDDVMQREVSAGETLSFLVEDGYVLERDGAPISSIAAKKDEEIDLTLSTIEKTVHYHDALGRAPADDTLDILMDDLAVTKTPEGFDTDVYAFLGWYERSDGRIDLKNGNQKVDTIPVSKELFDPEAGDIDLYALYEIKGDLSVTGRGPVCAASDTQDKELEICAVSGEEDPGKAAWFRGDVTLAFSAEAMTENHHEDEGAGNNLHFDVQYETRAGKDPAAVDEEALEGAAKLLAAEPGKGKVTVCKLIEAYVTMREEDIEYVYRTNAQAAVLTVHQDLCGPVVRSIEIEEPDGSSFRPIPGTGCFINRNVQMTIQAADVSCPEAAADPGTGESGESTDTLDTLSSGIGEITLILQDVIHDGIAQSIPLKKTKTAGSEGNKSGAASFSIPAQWLDEGGDTASPRSLRGRLEIRVSDKAGNLTSISPDDKGISRTCLETDAFFYETIAPCSRLMIDGKEYPAELSPETGVTQTDASEIRPSETDASEINALEIDASGHRWLKKGAELILEAHDDAGDDSSSENLRENAGLYILDYTVNDGRQGHTYLISPRTHRFEQDDTLHDWIFREGKPAGGSGRSEGKDSQIPVPGKAFTGTVPIPYEGEEFRDGRNTIAVRVFDLAGNGSRAAEYVFYRDTVEPSCILTGKDGETAYTEESVSFHTGGAGEEGRYWLQNDCGSLILTIRDDEADEKGDGTSETGSGLAGVWWTLTDPEGEHSGSVTYRPIDEDRVQFTHSFAYRDLKPGRNVLRVKASDQTGNIKESAYVFYVDKELPAVADLKAEGFEKSLPYGVFTNKALTFTADIEDGKYSSGIRRAELIYEYTNSDQEGSMPKKITLPLAGVSGGADPAGTRSEQEAGLQTLACKLDLVNTGGHIEIYLEDEAGNHSLYTDLGEKGKGFPSITSGKQILKNHFVIEDKVPELTVNLSKPACTDSERKNEDDAVSKPFKWYKDRQITLSWQIDDGTGDRPFSGTGSAEIWINGTALARREYEGKSGPVRNSTDNVRLDEAECIKYAANGENKLEIRVSDLAGNTVRKTCYVYVDSTAPKVSGFTFAGTVGGKAVKQSFKPTAGSNYGFFSSEKTRLTVSVEDEAPSSGLGTVRLLKLSEDGSMTVDERTIHVHSDPSRQGRISGKATFPIEKHFKGQIYASVRDRAGWLQTFGEDIPGAGEGRWRHSQGVIIESKASHESSGRHIQIRAVTKPSLWLDGRDNPLYKGDAQVNITVTDTWSGIQSAQLSVESKYDTGKNYGDTVSISEDGRAGRGWIVKRKDQNLVTEMTRTITVRNNSNDIAVNVRMTDHAGNSTTERFLLSIDKDAPAISVRFDPSDQGDDPRWTGYYHKPRTMIVTVKERNFDPGKIRFHVTKDQKGLKLPADFEKIKVSEGDESQSCTYAMKYVFRARDADFTLALSAQDQAGNRTGNEQVDYGSASERKAAGKFTIDQIKPVISVSLSGTKGSEKDGLVYYQSEVTAAVTVTERNFDPERFSCQIDVKANAGTENEGGEGDEKDKKGEENRRGEESDAAGQSTGPVSSGSWSSSGDTHQMTFSFTAQSCYTIVAIKARDKAGNGSNIWTSPPFIVDLEEPQIHFYTDSSMKEDLDHTARSGKVTPFVVVTDVNYERMDMELAGCRLGDLTQRTGQEASDDYRWEKGSIPGAEEGMGEARSFINFKKKESYDDIYILTVTAYDKAGRAIGPKSAVFSVNRYGSTYMPDEQTKALSDRYYIQMESPVTILEINDVPIDKDKTQVSITRDGVPLILKEGLDYSLTETEPLKEEKGEDSGKEKGAGAAEDVRWNTASHWYEYRYVIFQENFAREGRYSVNIQTTDQTQDQANIQTNEMPGHKRNLFAKAGLKSDTGSSFVIGDEKSRAAAPVMFIIDKTPPGLSIMDLPADQAFRQDRLDLSVICADAVKLDHVIFSLDGREEYIPAEEFEENGGTIVRTIEAAGNRQRIELRAWDMAGNESRYPSGKEHIALLVTSNWFYQLIHHPLWMMIMGSLAGGLFALVCLLIRSKRQKSSS